LRQIFKQILIRRINTLLISFENKKIIENFILFVQFLSFDYQFTNKKYLQYKEFKKDLLNKLVIARTNTSTKRKKKYFLRIYRKLQLLSMSSNLLKLNNYFNFKAKKIKTLF